MLGNMANEAGAGCAGVIIGGLGLFVLAPATFIVASTLAGETVGYRWLFAVVLLTVICAGAALTSGADT
jgi:hypothetical protein